MAFFQANMFSTLLGFSTDVNVFIPSPGPGDAAKDSQAPEWFAKDRVFQVLYLLHGSYGDHTDWFRMTGIERYAAEHKLAVVMPDASNSFYQDMYRGGAYLSFLTEELPHFAETYFPVSPAREDVFIAGLSMGGYGAWKAALTRPEKFSACASLSGALDIGEVYRQSGEDDPDSPFRWKDIFADPERSLDTNADLLKLIRMLQMEQRLVPRFWQCVGTEDLLCPMNRSVKEKMEKLDLDYTYAEFPGTHDWNFWDSHIRDVLAWLELKDDSAVRRQSAQGEED